LQCLAEMLAATFGVEVKVLNLDAEPHENYASWPEIYEESVHLSARLQSHVVWEEYEQYLSETRPDIVIVGAGDLVLPTVDFGIPRAARRVGEITKRVLGPEVTTYVYGVFPTLDPSEYYDVFDGVIVSEAETKRVLGRLMRRDRGLILGELTEDLDSVPLLRWERLVVPVDKANMDYIVSSRGCAWQCAYCATPAVTGRRIRHMGVGRFLNEVEFRLNEYGVTAQYFADMNLLVPKARGREICRQIIARGLKLKWWCEARSDSIDAEICALMKQAGCSHVKLGVEGNQAVMDALHKMETEERARQAVAMLKDAGLGVVAYTMLGAPGLADEDFQRSYEFLKSLEATHYVVNITVPHPGTPLYSQVKIEAADDWQHLDSRLKDLWGLREDTVQKFMKLNRMGKKEDSGIRRYGKSVEVAA